QNADGSWSESRYPHNTAITSYALLAFLSQGHLPDRGLYGPEVAKGARFLTASARPDGYLIGTRGGNMYCHGMATLALSQLYGMTGDAELRQALADAVELIVRTQSNQGGWRYEPRPTDADISVTIMQVMALRGAKNAGLHVPDRTMERALEYIERCYDPRSGGYRYQPGSRGPGFARTAAGICVTKLVGEYDRDVGKSVEYLKDNMESREHFFYGHYYAAHAMYQVGGKDWKEYYSKTRDMLLKNQDASGAWTTRSLDRNHVGPVYQTAIAVIVLSVPGHYLPIFQR
ncbi:MAG TPA: prenyltransferase/squalene oxidase repeat-containing protein, partial [Gemmataceae bacterium]